MFGKSLLRSHVVSASRDTEMDTRYETSNWLKTTIFLVVVAYASYKISNESSSIFKFVEDTSESIKRFFQNHLD